MFLTSLLSLSFLVGAAFSSTIVFDSNDHYNLTWSFTEKDITFTVRAETVGWIGLGFSPSGSMAGSDIIIGWVDDTGTAYLKDLFATDNVLPVVDNSQDVELISAGESNGVTTLTFKRSLDTGDSKDHIIRTDTTRLIWAYGSSDPTDNKLSSSNYHGLENRGSKSIYLLDKTTEEIELPADSKTHVFREPNVTIPAADTTYWCSWHKMPTFTQKNHVLKAAVDITPGNEAFVHHIIVYGCHGVTHKDIEEHGGGSATCFTPEMPDFSSKCSEVILAWAVGGSDFYYPENTGYPLGPGTGSPDYVLLEMHYDNPNLIEGVVDSSGISITYSETLREIDVGMFNVGMVNGIAVPPGDEDFKVRGYCNSDCTQQVWPEEGITVFSYILHAHLLGAGIRLDHYRNGKLLGTIASDDYYDFNYQEWRLFREPLKLLPGDHLETTCTMKSKTRSNVTFGGLGSREEMCITFLNYYPALNFSACSSVPQYLTDEKAGLYTGLGVKAQKRGNFVDMSSALGGISWNQAKRDEMEKLTLNSPYYMGCSGIGGYQYKLNKLYYRGEEPSSSSSLYSNISLLLGLFLFKFIL